MISTTAEYALRAVVYLASRPGVRVNRQEIAEATGVPADYLLKVLSTLDAVGIVQSKRGPGGGFRLACDPARTSTLSVIAAVDSLPRITHCPLGIPGHTQLCPLHQLLDDAASKAEEAFRRVTIRDLVNSQRRPASCVFPSSLP